MSLGLRENVNVTVWFSSEHINVKTSVERKIFEQHIVSILVVESWKQTSHEEKSPDVWIKSMSSLPLSSYCYRPKASHHKELPAQEVISRHLLGSWDVCSTASSSADPFLYSFKGKKIKILNVVEKLAKNVHPGKGIATSFIEIRSLESCWVWTNFWW